MEEAKNCPKNVLLVVVEFLKKLCILTVQLQQHNPHLGAQGKEFAL